ncbi:Dihydroxy-acid and 6-phosphogluconate dehydratase, partial [human gut metagenome]
AERKKHYVPHEPNVKTGWLARYASLVSSAKDGAVMKF